MLLQQLRHLCRWNPIFRHSAEIYNNGKVEMVMADIATVGKLLA